MTKYPTWEDMSIPLELVNSIKFLPPCYLLDSAVQQLVHRGKRRPQYTYRCGYCGHSWKPDRSSEEVTNCSHCNSYQISCTTQLRYNKEISAYTKRVSYLPEIVRLARGNFASYFKKEPPEPFVNCGWVDDWERFSSGDRYNVYAQFQGGDKVLDASPKMCLYKAAILCPYLWDNTFDWTEDSKTDTMNVEHISPMLHNYCHPQWLGGRLE